MDPISRRTVAELPDTLKNVGSPEQPFNLLIFPQGIFIVLFPGKRLSLPGVQILHLRIILRFPF